MNATTKDFDDIRYWVGGSGFGTREQAMDYAMQHPSEPTWTEGIRILGGIRTEAGMAKLRRIKICDGLKE